MVSLVYYSILYTGKQYDFRQNNIQKICCYFAEKIENVKKDLLFLLNNNAKIIKFLDRSFNVNKGYMLEILKFINENDNNFSTFQFEVVGDLLTDEETDYINK